MSKIEELVKSEIFGSRSKTGVLLCIFLLEETHYRELARTLGLALYSIQRTIEKLEEEGIVRSVQLGSERRVSLNPSFFAARELRALLAKIASATPGLNKAVGEIRRRPRKRGKAL